MGGRRGKRNIRRESNRDSRRSYQILHGDPSATRAGFKFHHPANQARSKFYLPATRARSKSHYSTRNQIIRGVQHPYPIPYSPSYSEPLPMGDGNLETGHACLCPWPWVAVGDCRRCGAYPLRDATCRFGMSRALVYVVRRSRNDIVFPLPSVKYPRPNVPAARGTGRCSPVVTHLSECWSHRLSMVRKVYCNPFCNVHSDSVFLPSY